MTTKSALIERRTKLFEALTDLGQRAELAGRPMSAADTDRYEKLDAEIRSLNAGIEAGERAYDRAFSRYLRSAGTLAEDDRRLLLARDAEARADGVSTGAAGGYLVPTKFADALSTRLAAFGGLLTRAGKLTTTGGQALAYPLVDDTSNAGRRLGESVQLTETDLVVAQRIFNAWAYTSDVCVVSRQLLTDAYGGFEDALASLLASRLGRAISTDIVTGTGVNMPTGLLTAIRTGVTGSAGQATSISYASLVNMVASVDAAYRRPAAGGASWLVNDQTWAAVKQITDTAGRPIWTPSIDGIERLLGFEVEIEPRLPNMGANVVGAVCFGCWSRGYMVRLVADPYLAVLEERFADLLQIGYQAWQRADGQVLDGNAIAAFKNSAT